MSPRSLMFFLLRSYVETLKDFIGNKATYDPEAVYGYSHPHQIGEPGNALAVLTGYRLVVGDQVVQFELDEANGNYGVVLVLNNDPPKFTDKLPPNQFQKVLRSIPMATLANKLRGSRYAASGGPVPLLTSADRFTVVSIPKNLTMEKLEGQYRIDGYVDLIWEDQNLQHFGLACRGGDVNNLYDEDYYFFPVNTPHSELVKFIKAKVGGRKHFAARTARRRSRSLPSDLEGVRKCTKQDKDDRYYSNQQKWCTFSHDDDLMGRYVNKDDAIKRKLQMIVEYNAAAGRDAAYSDSLQPDAMIEVAYRIRGNSWKRHIVRNRDFDKFIDKILDKDSGAEVKTREADPGSKPGPVRTL